MSQDIGMLRDAINAKTNPVYMTTYPEIKDYYQDKHGQKGWIGAMAQALSGSTSRSKSDKPYQAARRSIERFETGQSKSMKKYGGQVPTVGRTLPSVGRALKGGNEITLVVHGKASSKAGRPPINRTATVTIKGPAAQNFINNPTWDALWDEYGVPELGEDGDYAMDVYSVG